MKYILFTLIFLVTAGCYDYNHLKLGDLVYYKDPSCYWHCDSAYSVYYLAEDKTITLWDGTSTTTGVDPYKVIKANRSGGKYYKELYKGQDEALNSNRNLIKAGILFACFAFPAVVIPVIIGLLLQTGKSTKDTIKHIKDTDYTPISDVEKRRRIQDALEKE